MWPLCEHLSQLTSGESSWVLGECSCSVLRLCGDRRVHDIDVHQSYEVSEIDDHKDTPAVVAECGKIFLEGWELSGCVTECYYVVGL